MHTLVLTALLFAPVLPQPILTYSAPSGWQSRPAASSMRVAEFIVPRTSGDTEDADVVIFYFGGTGGSVEANIERWVGQFQQPPGASGKGERASFNVGNLKVTTVDVAGTYVAETRPGSGTRLNKPGFRMRAAVVETPRGPYFIKLTGPAATVGKTLPAFQTFLDSLKFQ